MMECRLGWYKGGDFAVGHTDHVIRVGTGAVERGHGIGKGGVGIYIIRIHGIGVSERRGRGRVGAVALGVERHGRVGIMEQGIV